MLAAEPTSSRRDRRRCLTRVADLDATTAHGSATDGATATRAPIDGAVPQDPDGDGLYEDVNGDGTTNLADAGDLFQHRDSAAVRDHVAAYDFSGNEAIDLGFDRPDAATTVTHTGSVPTHGTANLSVAVRNAGTGETIVRSDAQPYVIGWQKGIEQNSTNGTVQVTVNRSALHSGSDITTVIYQPTRSGTDGDSVQVPLTYDAESSAFVGTFRAAALDGGEFDILVDGELPLGPSIFQGQATAITVDGNSTT